MNDVSSAFALHLQTREREGINQAGFKCNKCTMKHGTYIAPNFSFGNRTNFSELDHGRWPICEAETQCVAVSKKDATGCCQKCEQDQFCVMGTLAFGGKSEAHLWNKCPPGYLCNSLASKFSDYIEKVSICVLSLNYIVM